MSGKAPRPDEAARALDEIRAQQRRTAGIDELPRWFWAAIGVLSLLFTAGIESRRPLVVAAAAVVFVAGLAAMVGWVVVSAPVRLRDDLLGARGGLAIAGFVVGLVGLTLATGFALTAAGARYPGTLAHLVTLVGLVTGGPLLTRHLRRVRIASAERAMGE